MKNYTLPLLLWFLFEAVAVPNAATAAEKNRLYPLYRFLRLAFVCRGSFCFPGTGSEANHVLEFYCR